MPAPSCSSIARRRVISSAPRRGSRASASTMSRRASSTTPTGRRALHARFLHSQRFVAERSLGRARGRRGRRRIRRAAGAGGGMTWHRVWIDVGALDDIRVAARGGCAAASADGRSPCSAPPTTGSSRWSTAARTRRAAVRRHRAGHAVTCPLHNWVIDLDHGAGARARRRLRRTLPVRLVDGRRACRPAARSPRKRRDGAQAPPVPIAASAAASRVAPTARSRGDPEHPANFGRLCSKGAALGRDAGDCRTGCCSRMIDGPASQLGRGAAISSRREFTRTVATHGPDAVAFYVSGQFLTEDYYVANKLMKGFIGSANIDTNSRLCMASSVAGHVRAFGEDVVPGCYEDLEEADLVVLVGSNMAWCHPVLYQRLMAAREKRGTKIVDHRSAPHRDRAKPPICICRSRRAPTSRCSTGLLAHLADAGALDRDWIDATCSGFRGCARCGAAIGALDRDRRRGGGPRARERARLLRSVRRAPNAW